MPVQLKEPQVTTEECPSQRALKIIDELTVAVRSAIAEIRDINENAKLLTLNARIEAARAGEAVPRSELSPKRCRDCQLKQLRSRMVWKAQPLPSKTW